MAVQPAQQATVSAPAGVQRVAAKAPRSASAQP